MLTLKEINNVNELLGKKAEIEAIISSFNSPYVKASVGLVALNSSDPWNPSVHDRAKFMHCKLDSIKDELNTKFLELVNAELKHTNAELSKYLKKEAT